MSCNSGCSMFSENTTWGCMKMRPKYLVWNLAVMR